MRSSTKLGRAGALLLLAIPALEVLIMISPFAGFFYASLQFEPILGLLSRSPWTAWLDGFFLNHALVTASLLLEWHQKAGLVLMGLGLAGFLVSAAQLYGNKILGRGVATGLLYRFVRHPQYLCLGVAGWGLLTQWPRFLLLGIWVTMLFLYAGLARFEEQRMAARFGEAYRCFANTRGAFLPGSPVRRFFQATFGKLRPRALGWAVAYVVCLGLTFSLGFALRAYTRASVATLSRPEHRTVVMSAWPKPESWMARVIDVALSDPRIRERLEEAAGGKPVVATILPPRYGMKGMYYKLPPGQASGMRNGGPLMGVDPDRVDEPVEVVLSQAEKPYREHLELEDALDADVRLTPLALVSVAPAKGEVTSVRIPLPQNHWGPQVIMSVF
jgi:protein-S-isoprenylcysteine O-methyltransferase Ste14